MTKTIKLFPYQEKAISLLKSGSILCGGVGSGKSLTSLGYYFYVACGGIEKEGMPFKMARPMDLYIISTAKKRDEFEWISECAKFNLFPNPENSVGGVKVTVDSWNNIGKYVSVKNAFFIFDEQRLLSYGAWSKNFLKIAQGGNQWLLLSATPGDTWMDYCVVMIANGFYKNKTEFVRRHVIYNPRVSFPKIDRYINTEELVQHKREIVVDMRYMSKAKHNVKKIRCSYDEALYKRVLKENWNVFEDEPLTNASEGSYTLRKVINSDPSRIEAIKSFIRQNKVNKIIIFYNFNYELEILRTLDGFLDHDFAEYNGHKHDKIPNSNKWIYAVQYAAGCEGWNCVETNFMAFYSLDHSYKKMKQASGRIDRTTTPFSELNYLVITTDAQTDDRIIYSLKNKKKFNDGEEFIREQQNA